MKTQSSKIVAVICTILLASICLFAENLKWLDNFENAKAAAKKEKKYILADFSGSDWCSWCKKLEKEVFSNPEFKKYASDNLILFMADFPRKKPLSPNTVSQNNRLKEKYNIQGFPTVLLLTSNGETVFTTGYQQGGPKPYIKSLENAINKDKNTSSKK